jgi:hypothetical protein
VLKERYEKYQKDHSVFQKIKQNTDNILDEDLRFLEDISGNNQEK